MSPSQIRTRGSWKFKRTSETDRWLDTMGFYRKHTARDPSCLFRAVSENVFNTQKYFQKVRSQCVDYMAKTRNIFEAMIHGSIDNYLQKIASPNEWGGMIEINALSRLYRHDFVIFDNTRKEPQTKISNGYGDTIYLFYIQDINHFDTVYKKEYIKVASFSQSIIYEALYAGVFQLTDLPYAVDKMLHDKIPTNQLEYLLDETVENKNIIKNDVSDMFNNANDQNLSVFDLSGQKYVPNIVEEQILDQNNNTDMKLVCKNQPKKKDKKGDEIKLVDLLLFNNQCGGVDEDDSYLCIDVNSARNLLDYGITPFPYKVAKALDPDIYRNIEYDVWNEMRRELKYGVRYGDGSVLQVGVKCLCKIETHQEESYHCHIQEMTADRGPCLVFIEELGEKRLVNYDQLEPIPIEQAKAWIFPHRNLQNNPNYYTLIQQMGNVSRKSSPLKTNSKVKGDVHDDADIERSNQKKQSQVKQYKPKSNWKALPLAVDVREDGNQNNMLWGIDDSIDHKQCSAMPSNINLALYNHMDYMMFEPYPIEYLAMPIITECHSAGEGAQGSGISPQPTHKPAQQNGPSGDGNNVLNQMTPTSNEAGVSVSGDCGSTMFTSGGGSLSPHNANTLSTFSNYNVGSQFNVPPPPYVVYGGMMNSGNALPGSGSFGAPPPVSGKPMAGGMPPQPLMSPPLPPLPPSTYGVNVSAAKSSHPNGQDLPLNDLQTVRFFFNLGVDYLWYWANIQPVGMPSMGLMPAHPPHLHNVYLPMPHQSHQPQHRVNDLDDLSQDFQTLNFMDRGSNPNQGKAGNKNKQDNMNNKGGKGMGQNPGPGVRGAPLGPRFKRGDTMLSGNKGNGGNNKGNNNMRRSSYGMPPNIQSPVGNENCISCCDEQVMIGGGPPLPQPTQYYTFGLPEDLVMQAPMVDPSAAYLMPGLPTHYVGYGYCPPGYYAAGPPMGPPPPMGAYCPSGPPMGPPLYCAPPNEMPK